MKPTQTYAPVPATLFLLLSLLIAGSATAQPSQMTYLREHIIDETVHPDDALVNVNVAFNRWPDCRTLESAITDIFRLEGVQDKPGQAQAMALWKWFRVLVSATGGGYAFETQGHDRRGMVKDPLARGRLVVGEDGEADWQRPGGWPTYGDVLDPLYPDTVIATRWQVLGTIVAGYAALVVPALAAVFVGFLIGTLFDSSGLSIGLAVAVSVTLVLGEFFPGFADYLAPFGYNYPVPKLATIMLNASKGSPPVWDDVLAGVGVSAIYVVVSLLVSILVFCRRDVTL